jgi:hypothetical protein
MMSTIRPESSALGATDANIPFTETIVHYYTAPFTGLRCTMQPSAFQVRVLSPIP